MPPQSLRVLIERPAAGSTSRQTALTSQRLLSRRSTSQTDFLIRQQRARDIKQASTGSSWKQLKEDPVYGDMIKLHTLSSKTIRRAFAPLPPLKISTEHREHISIHSCA